MLEGKISTALDYFWGADQMDPYYMYGAELREGVLSFLGRAQYLTGNYASASDFGKRPCLSQERQCRTTVPGLTLVQSPGDREAGLTQIQRGMSGIYNWLEYLNTNFALEFGQGWIRVGPSGPALKAISP